MTFRPATIHDAPLLHQWRFQAESQPWYHGQRTTYEQHLNWLRPRINNPLVDVLIWLEDGDPAGMVRIESNGELAFHVDTDEIAVGMLRATEVYARNHGGRLKATVDLDDVDADAALHDAGFVRYPATFFAWKPSGLVAYWRSRMTD